jgi:hypothetical protein
MTKRTPGAKIAELGLRIVDWGFITLAGYSLQALERNNPPAL